MSRGARCSICSHEKAAEIDLGLSRNVPVRVLARRYGVGEDALYRHRTNHLSPQLRAQLALGSETPIDLDKLREDEGSGLIANLVKHRGRILQAMDQAEANSDLSAVARLSGEVHKNLELVAKTLGVLIQKHEVSRVSILVSQDYLALRATIVQALRPYPEAQAAVASALRAMEADAAKVISEKQQPKIIEHEPHGNIATEPTEDN